MILSNAEDDISDAHPYRYARIIGIYHAYASVGNAQAVRYDLLHVRWFRRDRSVPSGWLAKRLPRLSFIPADEEDAFGFLDPADIVRASHIMPAFAHGRTPALLSHSPIGRVLKDGKEDGLDWRYHYVGM